MPFRSQAQRRFMFARHPEIAKRWAAEYPNQGKLPERVGGHHALMRAYAESKRKKKR
jgi:hypothetical protein